MKHSTFQDFLNDMKHGVYDLTQNGKCTGCGNCCSNILPMTDSEIKIIRRYIKIHHIKEQKITASNFLAVPETIDLTCPFLDKNTKDNKKCLIYEVRPSICRSFVCNKTKEECAKDTALDMPAEDVKVVFLRQEFYG